MIETAGRKMTIERDMAFGKDGPAGQGVSQGADPAYIPGNRSGALGAGGQARLTVKRQPVMFVHIRPDFGHRRRHPLQLLAVILD